MSQPVNDAASKLKAVRRAAEYSFPTSDIDQMLREIDRGRDIDRGWQILIFIDSNIPMYLVGGAHPHKADAQLLLEGLIAAGQRLITDAEV